MRVQIRVAALLGAILTIRAEALDRDATIPHAIAHATVHHEADEGSASAALAQVDNATAVDQAILVESFDVQPHGDALLLPVTIGDREYQFILDTGTSITVFDKSLESLLIPTLSSVTITGHEATLYECRGATVGRSRLSLEGWALCKDLTEFREYTGHSLYGILGIDFLRGRVIQIDFEAGRLHVLTSSRGAPGERITLGFRKNGLPTVAVDFPGLESRPFLVDTGFLGIRDGGLSSSSIQHLIDTDQINLDDFDVESSESRAGVISKMKVHSVQEEQRRFGESTNDRDILGLGYLSRYTVTIDHSEARLYLAKRPSWNRNLARNRSGLRVGMTSQSIFITVVEKDSPGFVAGVSVGDQLLEINGKSVDKMTLHSSRLQLFSSADLELKIVPRGKMPRTILLSERD